MKFQAFVPDAVREKIAGYLDGIPDMDIPGFLDLLETLRADRSDTDAEVKELSRSIQCLQRLGSDLRMREVFELLDREFTSASQWGDFIYAAWAADRDYTPSRDGLKQAKKLSHDIARAAEKLAGLIRQFEDTGIYGPSEFHSVPDLLRQTDAHNLHDKLMWRCMRHALVGPQRQATNPPADEDRFTPRFVEVAEHDPRQTLLDAWRAAPDLPSMLDALAKTAKNFTPNESGTVGAAVRSRQTSRKTEYLRAFGELMLDHSFTMSPRVISAMALTASVVINLPDFAVSSDDVRDALAK